LLELHRALGLKPWEISPFDVDDDGEVLSLPLIAALPEDRAPDRAVRLRRALLSLCPPGKVGRHGKPWSAEDDRQVSGMAASG
jgi:hypothetical protein